MDKEKISFKDSILWSIVALLIFAPVIIRVLMPGFVGVKWSITWVSLLLAAAAVAWITDKGRQFSIFLTHARKELFRVVWPTRKETLQTGSVVIVVMIIMAILVLLIDFLIGQVPTVYRYLMGIG